MKTVPHQTMRQTPAETHAEMIESCRTHDAYRVHSEETSEISGANEICARTQFRMNSKTLRKRAAFSIVMEAEPSAWKPHIKKESIPTAYFSRIASRRLHRKEVNSCKTARNRLKLPLLFSPSGSRSSERLVGFSSDTVELEVCQSKNPQSRRISLSNMKFTKLNESGESLKKMKI
jgi:hypothetical protein